MSVEIEGIDSCVCLGSFDDDLRALILGLKYRNQRACVQPFASAIAAVSRSVDVDLVTWAPTTPRRRRSRGFDQSELLARRVARVLSVPARRVLVRVPGPTQTGADAGHRSVSPLFEPRYSLDTKVVLVVDDVVTTGSTMRSAAAALRLCGARSVHSRCLAHVSRLVVAR